MQEILHNFLVDLDTYIKKIESGNEEGLIFVFMDESYIHQNHCMNKTYLSQDQWKNGVSKKLNKGRRLIILHAITSSGVLAQLDENGMPVSDLVWTKDTPHPNKNCGKHTCETLWLAESHSGDYHDNMNSETFIQWINDSLFPTFEKLHHNKKMILVCDNAPYHHKQKIGSLASTNKKDLLQMMAEYNTQYIDLPLTTDKREDLADAAGHLPNDDQDMGDSVRIPFVPEEQKQTARASTPRVATLEELKVAFVSYLKVEKPDALKCIVEQIFKEKGHHILWTPPYSPDLQPIEKFWAAGKNHAAWHHTEGQKMQKTVELLREGWYGTGSKYPPSDERFKAPVDCRKLVLNSWKLATTKFVPLCNGLSGEIGNLNVDADHTPEPLVFPIDTLVLNLTNEDGFDDENFLLEEEEI